jgi:hypothetical protein
MLEAILQERKARIAADEEEISTLESALSYVQNDPWYDCLAAKYFGRMEDEDIARDMNCSANYVWQNRRRLVQEIAVLLYGSSASA